MTANVNFERKTHEMATFWHAEKTWRQKWQILGQKLGETGYQLSGNTGSYFQVVKRFAFRV